MSSDRTLELLADLSTAFQGVHSEIAFVTTVHRVLQRYVTCQSVELQLHLSQGEPSSVARVEGARRARAFLRVAVRDGDESGAVVIGLDDSPDTPIARTLESILPLVFQHLRLVQRVAALSRRAHAENRLLRGELRKLKADARIVAVSESMQQLLEQAELVAPQETTVLILGESGVGKELLAERIHTLSGRSNRPFLKVNCGALPEQLAESILFGHERGAFTGATTRHTGLFERANGGTLFLDEVGELPMPVQAKLLRVLQSGEFERVGGERTLETSVRVISATHRPLESMVESRAFREDLYYRLSVFPLHVPPLRDRPADIPVLAEALLNRLARKHRRSAPALTEDVLRRLLAHRWPGNVRELENVLERSLILTRGETLSLHRDLPAARVEALPHRATSARRQTLSDVTRQHIEEVLRECGGKIYGSDGAAARLGMKPTTLQSKMKKLGVRRTTAGA